MIPLVSRTISPALALAALAVVVAGPTALTPSGTARAQEPGPAVQLGPRPHYLIDDMDDGPLKTRLLQCAGGPFYQSDFSIGHRGAPMQFPEHTVESYTAAARMGAGVLECDVTFTRDRALVCRHSQCDLHTTTNILAIPDLAAKCTEPFNPADPASGRKASAKCCTSDITLAEFRRLRGKMDAADPDATTVADYLGGTAGWRTDLYAQNGTLMTHRESIDLFRTLGARFTPELKTPSVTMPFEGDYSQEDYARQLVDDYVAAGIDPNDVHLQSFNLADIEYWLDANPEFGRQAVYLDDRYTVEGFDPMQPETWSPTMADLAGRGVRIIAPPMWMLVTVDAGRIVPSAYAVKAHEAGLDIITWTLERSGPLAAGGGWYYQSIREVTDNDGDMMTLLHVLATDVGVLGIFTDWPATVTYYANCMGLE